MLRDTNMKRDSSSTPRRGTWSWLDEIRRCNLFSRMTTLQIQATNLGICSRCHSKTLTQGVNGNGYRWHECSTCQTYWVEDK